MIDVNYPLRKIYYAALSTLTYNDLPLKAFYQKAPDNIEDSNYIVFGGISNTDQSSKSNSDTDTSIRVTVHTFRDKFNDGSAADAIAGLIFSVIYPNATDRADMSADNLQLVGTILSGDFVQNYNIQGNREYVDRVLTFKHRIFQQS